MQAPEQHYPEPVDAILNSELAKFHYDAHVV